MNTMNSNSGVLLHQTIRKTMEGLSDQKQGRLFRAILLRAESGTEPDFGEDAELLDAWKRIQSDYELGEN